MTRPPRGSDRPDGGTAGPSARCRTAPTSAGFPRPAGRPRRRRSPPSGRHGPRTRRRGSASRTARPWCRASPGPRRGSPRWVSSQSSTPCRPSSPIIRLPVRKSPCTRVSAAGAGRCSASQRRPISRAGLGSAKARYKSVSWRSASILGKPGIESGSTWWIRAKTSPRRRASPGRTAAYASSRSSRRGMVSPSRRSISR